MKKILGAFILMGMGFFLYWYTHRVIVPAHTQVVFAEKTFAVEVVSTEKDLERGLSGHVPLRDDEGMLFVFPVSNRYGFWMKDMTFPIDILWINEDNRVVHIEHSLATSTYPKVFYPTEPARFVLEISAGQSSISGIHIGDFVHIQNMTLK